ncbi:Non-classical export protein-like protein [Hapsidospora chrysogenum ATCC 11550]|uniref:Non-classical export protein-like protein n=1 Tax=Hapsidospora chrysogenum (strain ATCC 11550 / CBS 779.69 / DSM 880 / IAM 14645 / JCM 23072 / IMI 49137) TaxID=857340 RepID=A0A086SX71_HAPC1|nr:Non-classical export protein-like protein [Hapsidospora chrysogenum ATCC 11550]
MARSNWIDAALRVVALVWTLIITALIGNVIASNINGSGGATMTLNFTMFVAAWSWVTGIYGLGAAFVGALAQPLILIPLDVIAVLFTFIDAVVLSAKLKAVDCSNTAGQPRKWIGFGSNSTEKRCREIQASLVFMWFLWATFCGCLTFTILRWREGSSRGFRGVRPSMSQVRA